MQSTIEAKRHLVNGFVSQPPPADMQSSIEFKRHLVNGFVLQPPPSKRLRVEMMEKEETLALRKKHVTYVST